MSVLLWVVAVAIGIPTLIVASYPIHALVVFRRSRRYRTNETAPAISVLIPVRGLDEGRAHAVQQALAQRTGGPIEWLFCVESEADPAVPPLREVADMDPDRVRLIITGDCGARLGKLHNLIEGIARARGTWLVFIDSDTILPNADYLRSFTAHLHRPSVGLVTCFPAYVNAHGIPAALLSGAINHDLLGHFAVESVWGGLRLANGSCMAIRKDVLERIGGFVPQESSVLMDVILAERVHAAGYEVQLHHEPVAVPCRTVTMRVWWNQAHRWQVGIAQVLSGAFYAWYCWMRTVFPVAMVVALVGSGPLVPVAAAAVLTRLSVMVIMSQVFVGDRRQLLYLWLLPILEIVTAFGCWYALLANTVEWRGRQYRVLAGGVTRRLA